MAPLSILGTTSDSSLEPRHHNSTGSPHGHSWTAHPQNTTNCATRVAMLSKLSLASEMTIMVTWLGTTLVILLLLVPIIWLPVARGDYRWYTPAGKTRPHVGRRHRWWQLICALATVALIVQASYGGDMNLRYYKYCSTPLEISHHWWEVEEHGGSVKGEKEHYEGLSFKEIPGALSLSMIIWLFGFLEICSFIRILINVVLGHTKQQRFLGGWWAAPTPMWLLLVSPLILLLKCCLAPYANRERNEDDKFDMSNVFLIQPSRRQSRAGGKSVASSHGEDLVVRPHQMRKMATLVEAIL